MDKTETKHLLKIKKQDYPEIFDFLEGLPRGTKTAHIREALLRYISELGQNPPIPSKTHTTALKSNTQAIERTTIRRNEENYQNSNNQQVNTDYIHDEPSNKNEEMIDVDVDQF